MGQCPAKSGLWSYNFITIKIVRCTKQHIFATVLPFPFKFRTLVSTPFLCVKIDFCERSPVAIGLFCLLVSESSVTEIQLSKLQAHFPV